jgi:hypothetical protein
VELSERIKSRLRLKCSKINQRLEPALKSSTTAEYRFAPKRIVQQRCVPTVGHQARMAKFIACCAKWVWQSYNSMRRLNRK